MFSLPGVSLSCAATVGTAVYIVLAVFNLYRLMNPLAGVDLATVFPPADTHYVPPLWNLEGEEEGYLGVLVYLSHLDKFRLDFLSDEGEDISIASNKKSAILVWENPSIPSSVFLGSNKAEDASLLQKSLILTTQQHFQRTGGDDGATTCCVASERILSTHSGNASIQQEIGSSSFILRFLDLVKTQWIFLLSHVKKAWLSTLTSISSYQADDSTCSMADDSSTTCLAQQNDKGTELTSTASNIMPSKQQYSVVQLDQDGPIWNAMMHNQTVYLHVIVTKNTSKQSRNITKNDLIASSQKHSLRMGSVPLVKYDQPLPRKPTRILIQDIIYVFQRYILQSIPSTVSPPWSNTLEGGSKNKDFTLYQKTLQDKQNGVSYPFFKPEVAVKLVTDTTQYPLPIAMQMGLEVVNLRRASSASKITYGSTSLRSDALTYGYLPFLFVDEIGLTSEKYVHLNESVTDVPLRITLDTLSPQRHRLMSVLESSLNGQGSMGFEKSDIDDVRRLISETNVVLLGVTVLASVLHLLFEFLTFKSDVDFWNNNTDLTGLSVRTLFGDLVCQLIILAYLLEQESSLLMTVPACVGIAIAIWKCQRAAGFKLIHSAGASGSWFGGWRIEASRLQKKSKLTSKPIKSGGKEKSQIKKRALEDSEDVDMLSLEMDKQAFNTLGKFLFPVIIALAIRSLIVQEYSGWYSWFIASASGSVYALGFVLMTPQLFMNYKLKSVAHLPWKVLCYKFLNTFIDDLFAFIIRMPTMARISCFRDDVVFFVYLFQRWMYPVDKSRPVEGGNS